MTVELIRARVRRRITSALLGTALAVTACAAVGAAPVSASGVRAAAGPSSAPALLRYQQSRPSVRGVSPVAMPARSPKTGAACAPAVSHVASPNTASAINDLEAVAALNPSNMWAVGRTGPLPSARTLAEHWNGSTWTIVATPNVGTDTNSLQGVTANDANDVWAVGSAGANTLAVHWNGVSWSVVPSPQPQTDQFFSGVSSLGSNDVWAIGGFLRTDTGVFQGLSAHWTGSAFVTLAMPQAGAGDNFIQNVYERAPTDVWAVGYYLAAPATNTPQLTLIEHWNGTAWSIVSSPNGASGDTELLNVSADSATDAWAVGFTTASGVAQTLTMHLVTGAWTIVASQNVGTGGDNLLFGVIALSPTNAWSVGFGRVVNGIGANTLVEHWDGSAWTIESSDNPGGSNGNQLVALAALPGNDVWAVGGFFSPTTEATLTEQFQLPAPTAVTAIAGDTTASVSWTALSPGTDCGFTTTGYVVTASDGCTVVASQTSATSPLTFLGLSNGSPYTFTVQAMSASLGAETPSALSAAVTPNGASGQKDESACSGRQYQLTSPSSTTFSDIDSTALALSVTPSAASTAVITGNADLWTANLGVNQDIGIFVSGGSYASGQVVGWKESGGSAGTFSPNAAAVQTAIPLASGVTYLVKLQWKANKPAPGASIFAGAGPLSGDYRFTGSLGVSPTRLTLHLVPAASSPVTSLVTNSQYPLSGSSGTTWTDVDTANLTASVTPTADSTAVITGNIDLWTANSGFNQDIAITVDGTVVAWKESGGSAGTFSPNAAFVQAVMPLTVAGSPHIIKLQWKTNKPEGSAKIYAGAGPWPAGGSVFSPTRLTVWLAAPTSDLTAVPATKSTLQYHLSSSDGAGWTPIDNSALQVMFTPGVVNYTYSVTGNLDLWTANSGFNQDIGIFISGGVYGTGTLVAWKESGGSAGTFSPNAAFVDSVQHFGGGVSYTIWLAWKTNKQGAGSTIYAAAGPWPPASATFSPSVLGGAELSSP